MKSDEIGTTLKHSETINGNVKNLSKKIEMKDKENVNFNNITINCFRMFESGYNLIGLHMQKVEF